MGAQDKKNAAKITRDTVSTGNLKTAYMDHNIYIISVNYIIIVILIIILINIYTLLTT